MTVVIEKDAPITDELQRTKEFTTTADNQDTITFNVFEGESADVKDNQYLGQFRLSGIPRAKRGFAKVNVTFKIDPLTSSLDASAVDLTPSPGRTRGEETQVKVNRKTGGLTEKDKQRLNVESSK
jgi:molecular chaperone DnaK (HSP70)